MYVVVQGGKRGVLGCLIPLNQNGTVHSGCTDPTQATACYCSCMQVTKEQYWGQLFCQMERDILVRPTKMTRPVKVGHLQSWSQLFRSDQTEMDHSIWWTNQNFRNFGLNGNKALPWTPLSGGYWGLTLCYKQLIYPTTFSCFCWNFVTLLTNLTILMNKPKNSWKQNSLWSSNPANCVNSSVFTTFKIFCVVPKNIHTPTMEEIGNSEGMGRSNARGRGGGLDDKNHFPRG